MGRPRIELGACAEARIVAMMARGAPAEAIAKAIGASQRTVTRRMRELRAGVPAARIARRTAAAAAFEPLPEEPEDIPPETNLSQINAWLALAKREVDEAKAAGETEIMMRMVRLAATLLELQRKATPVPRADPNDNPDFVASAARVRNRWHELLDKVAGKR